MGIYRSAASFEAALRALETSTSLEEARAKHGIPTRTLRDWMAREGLGTPSARLNRQGRFQPESLLDEWDYDPESRTFWKRGPSAPATRVTKILVCPDAHHPHADPVAWRTFVNAVAVVQPDELLVLGDFVDCSSVSFHEKGPATVSRLATELAAGNKALDELDIAAGDARKRFFLGNHEDRLRRYIMANAPALEGLVSLEGALHLDKRGWEVIQYKESMKIGEITFTHDIGRCGKYTAQQSLADFGDNIVVAHSHRACVAYAGTVAGKTHVGMNVGNLVDYKSIDYRHKDLAHREWQHGFGMIHMDGAGTGWVTFVPVIGGKCIVEGKEVFA